MVADVFDALCSERPYKKAFSFEESIRIIDQETPSHFDPQIVAVFSTISKGLYEQLSKASESDIKNLVIEKMKLYFYNS
jgi:HD-GYP domain-containing protein (c-di-GMP phosphodiesterase class II)